MNDSKNFMVILKLKISILHFLLVFISQVKKKVGDKRAVEVRVTGNLNAYMK